MTSEGIFPLPLNTANTPPIHIPWPVLPGRGRRGILKSMTAENEGAFKKQSSTSRPVVNTSTQVDSNENVHSQDRSCSEPGRHSTLLGSSGEYTFKRLKLNHMVPSGFPIVYWHRGEAKLSQQRANGRKAGILMSIREGSLSLPQA